MKKKMIALLAGALMTLAASNAFAFVGANLELYRVVYDSTTNTTYEAITDLGNINSIKSLAGGTQLDSATSAFANVAGYSAANVGSNLKIAYFAFDSGITGAAKKDVYLSQTGETAAPVSAPSKWASAGTAMKGQIIGTSALSTNYLGGTKDASAMTSTIPGGNTATNSFKRKLIDGSFGGYLSTNPTQGVTFGAVSLAALAANNVTHIYWFQGDTGVTGQLALSLTTDTATGITKTASTVPIPPAFFLMGSGLLGMVGLRRKRK